MGLAIAMTLWLASSPANAQSAQQFLFIGDLPYSSGQAKRLTEVIGPAIKKARFPFLVHYGDFKGGGIPCSEAGTRAAYKQITGLMSGAAGQPALGPVFYTPGDNDWTDCDRLFRHTGPGGSKSELAQLDLLRRVFYLEFPLQLDKEWQFSRQSLYPENMAWRSGKIQFGTVHLVGTNNGRLQIRMDDVAVALARVAARDQANRAWLNEVFDRARNFRNPADAVIITTQADVSDPDESAPCRLANQMSCDAFADFRAQLAKHAVACKKPVLLVHGDTGPYCLDKRFGGADAPNLWRLNAGGDFHRPLDATVVTFRSGGEGDVFTVRGLVAGESPKSGC